MGQHKGNPDERRDETRWKTDEKVANTFLAFNKQSGEVFYPIRDQRQVRKMTGIPKTTVHDSFKRLVKTKRIRKVAGGHWGIAGGYQLSLPIRAVDLADQNEPLVQHIQQKRREISWRERRRKELSPKRFEVQYPMPKSDSPWLQEIVKRKPIRSNRGS
jgi:hypothetical protein